MSLLDQLMSVLGINPGPGTNPGDTTVKADLFNPSAYKHWADVLDAINLSGIAGYWSTWPGRGRPSYVPQVALPTWLQNALGVTLDDVVTLVDPSTGNYISAPVTDTGPAEWTNRIADLSAGAAEALWGSPSQPANSAEKPMIILPGKLDSSQVSAVLSTGKAINPVQLGSTSGASLAGGSIFPPSGMTVGGLGWGLYGGTEAPPATGDQYVSAASSQIPFFNCDMAGSNISFNPTTWFSAVPACISDLLKYAFTNIVFVGILSIGLILLFAGKTGNEQIIKTPAPERFSQETEESLHPNAPAGGAKTIISEAAEAE